ncbi:endopeptidase La [Selenihalanaerobacter shriftii]|uniref:Lon protease n=1 Tax=Selenihalanaerobacter shriftii TaxID=142842 RepID=A0A1T4MNC1_9FIRM|nr:endopeptidase La [Selenihalanaerobacter shriftii]SJZ68284.1 ATP-dependent proteinase. Serine peptidase. MEROPS family S16 [Selenihalanaerobacter shriftii]
MVKEIDEIEIGQELPLLVLRGLVVFPHMVMPLLVGRDKSIEALEEAMVEDRLILLAAQKDETIEEPELDEIYDIGTVAQVKQLVKLPDGTIKILVEGIKRAKISEYIQEEPYFKVGLEQVEGEEEKDQELEALMRSLISQFEEYVKLNKKLPPETMMTVVNVEDPGRLVDIMVSHMSLKVTQEQEILKAISYKERLEELYKLLNKEIEVLKAEEKISSRVRSQVEKRQKEYYLKEQLKAIKKELGDDNDISNEIDEYREKIEETELPEEVEEKALKEVDRLDKMPPMANEGVVIRNYLDCILDLPWNDKSEDRLVLDEAEDILERDHYGLEDVKDRILEYLAVRKLTSEMKSPILCLVGPPGVGKTSLGKSIAEAIGREFVRLSLGGVKDEAEIRGHRRTYVGSRPGRIINAIRDAGTNNPLFLLDEVDKISSDFRGDPASALLEVLDPEQNDEFADHYLELPFDLSDVIFVTTANVSHTIPRPLLDRMEVIRIPGYTEEEKVKIAERHLLSKQIENHGLDEEQINVSTNAIKSVIRNYTREAGVRNLERKLANICRKVAKEVVKGKETLSRVTVQNVDKYLGIEKFSYGEANEKPQVGVATGLAWTKTGGDILKIEVSVVPGKGKLLLTGKLGDVMKESAQAALSYARSKVKEFNLEEEFHEKYDIHVHVPKGAIPKDGPSAGITIAMAIISALSKEKVNEKIAMTGEITLRGRVLPVGGIKSKVLAAHRAGVEKIILCEENKKNLEDVPKNIKKDLEFKLVEHMDEVIATALLKEE